ncbi:unnamed protein product, partial [Musa hybrid cultivar]
LAIWFEELHFVVFGILSNKHTLQAKIKFQGTWASRTINRHVVTRNFTDRLDIKL